MSIIIYQLDKPKSILSKKRKKLTANMIVKGLSTEQKMYVNERLTKARRLLFYKTRNISKEKQYKYVWITNADILVKKNDASTTIRIKSEADINKL